MSAATLTLDDAVEMSSGFDLEREYVILRCGCGDEWCHGWARLLREVVDRLGVSPSEMPANALGPLRPESAWRVRE